MYIDIYIYISVHIYIYIYVHIYIYTYMWMYVRGESIHSESEKLTQTKAAALVPIGAADGEQQRIFLSSSCQHESKNEQELSFTHIANSLTPQSRLRVFLIQ